MFGYFTKIFGRNTKKTTKAPPPRTRLRVEELNQRVLPSANWTHMALSHAADTPLVSLNAQTSASLAEDVCRHGAARGAAFVASLTNASGATGQASFNPTTGDLTVKVQGAAASTSLSVAVGGTAVGTLTTDTSGNGKVTLTEAAGAVQSGTTITVGDLTGTFSQVEFTAALTGTTGVSGSAKYNARRNALSVSITGASADTLYNVTVDGTVVGQLTTNDSGAGHLRVSPSSSVTIQSGSTLAVSDTAGNPPILQGSFA